MKLWQRYVSFGVLNRKLSHSGVLSRQESMNSNHVRSVRIFLLLYPSQTTMLNADGYIIKEFNDIADKSLEYRKKVNKV